MLSPLMARAALLATLAACTSALAATNVYRWVDQAGKVHFSDTPPPEEAKSVSQKRLGGGYAEQSQLPYATQIAAKRNPVTLYTASDCGTPCERGRDLLAKRGIPFSERNAQANPADAEALKKLSGSPEVPFLVIGENKLKGYDEDSWQAGLDAGGYPRTRLPGQAVSQAAPPAKAPAPAAPASAPPPQR